MRINPINPVYKAVNPPPHHPDRAVMVINHDQHTVVNMTTGERHTLPAKQAWDLHQRLNLEV
jgi:hypothetical protein